jgi:hypothetical protein
VLVIQIDLELLHAWLKQIEVPSLRVRTSGTDKLDVRILFADGIAELLEACSEYRSKSAMLLIVIPLLVTNTKELEVEWSWMTHIGAYLSPLRIGRTIGKLDEVESILDIRLKIFDCYVNTWLGGVGVLELA